MLASQHPFYFTATIVRVSVFVAVVQNFQSCGGANLPSPRRAADPGRLAALPEEVPAPERPNETKRAAYSQPQIKTGASW